MFKVIAIALLVSSGLIGQEAKPVGATPEMFQEVDRVNRTGPSKSWVTGTQKEILVCCNSDMWWKLQSSMMLSATAQSYREKGITTLIIFNGKNAWIGSTDPGGSMEPLKHKIPMPADTAGLEKWTTRVEEWNKDK